MSRFRLACALFFVAALAIAPAGLGQSLPGTGEDAGKTVIYRDTWGVPHIYAPSVEAGMYAMGWAQAEDRPHELLKNFKRGLGELASVEGQGGLSSDQRAHMWRLYEYTKEHAHLINPTVRSHLQAFAQGINDYYDAHPEDVPQWWGDRDVDEFMAIAFNRLFLQNWSFDDGFDDLERGGIEPGFDRVERGSNQWAVSPKRSAVKAPILLIDPHLGWFGASRFWEFRIHAGELRGSGFSLPGSPYIGLGHNDKVAWAMTTGGPDTADVYELKLKEDDPLKYEYDGSWRELKVREVTVQVKDGEPRTFTIYESHHGPLAAIRNGKGYAIKSSYADAINGTEAWWEFNRARDYRGMMTGLATLEVFPQNVMAADTSGNIYYQRTGRVPKRPDGYDWSRPVDGSTSATEWQGLHPTSDLLQVLNPPQGYMQNCNIPPDAMMPDSPFSLAATKPYIYADLSHGGQRDGWSNQRGARAIQYLQADESVTIEEALAYAVDTQLYGSERWLSVLRKADERFGSEIRSDADVAGALDELLAWDRELRPDSKGALKYYYWRRQMVEDHGADTMRDAARRIDNYRESLGEVKPLPELSDEELRGALTSFANAVKTMKSHFGTLDKVYGDVFRVGRDEKSWPLGGGGDGHLGMTTFRNVGYGSERPDHTRWGRSGQTSTQIIVLTEPIQSWTYVPIGQSDRRDSAHYCDQAEKLFSPARLKPTWWRPEELKDHIESRTVLEKRVD